MGEGIEQSISVRFEKAARECPNKIAAQKLEGILSELELLSDEDAKKLFVGQESLKRSGDRRE